MKIVGWSTVNAVSLQTGIIHMEYIMTKLIYYVTINLRFYYITHNFTVSDLINIKHNKA